MRVLDLLKPVLEDFFRFAREVDKEFLSYIEREELYEGLKKIQELKEREQEPLKKLYCDWTEKNFKFLIDRWVCLEEDPGEQFLLASGLKGSKRLMWSIVPIIGDAKDLTEEEYELRKYISESLEELRVYAFASGIADLVYLRGDCGGKKALLSPLNAVKRFEIHSDNLVYDWELMAIPNALKLKHIYDMFFTEYHDTFSRILSERLSQAIQEGFPEKHIRIINTAIAVIKEDPESLPEGEPQSFAEKWLREELRV